METALFIRPELDLLPDTIITLQSAYRSGVELRDYAQKRTIVQDADLTPATDDLAIIAGMLKDIETRRKNIVTPLRDRLDAINETFKAVKGPLSEADTIYRQKVTAYTNEQKRRQAEAAKIEEEKLALARREQELTGSTTIDLGTVKPVEVVTHVRTEMGSVGVRKDWKFEVVDFAALPDEYKMPDGVKIGKVIRAGVSIQGVRSWTEDGLRVTPSRG